MCKTIVVIFKVAGHYSNIYGAGGPTVLHRHKLQLLTTWKPEPVAWNGNWLGEGLGTGLKVSVMLAVVQTKTCYFALSYNENT